MAAVAAVSLSGCVPQTESVLEPQVVEEALPDGVTQPTDVPQEVANDPVAHTRVEVLECAASAGGWRATGIAQNVEGEGITYAITVFFTTEGGTVIGFGDTEVKVPPDSSVGWEIAAEFGAADPTLCVLRGATVTP